ncbi:MAG: PKD domain-containing protein [Candidatus Aminicenantales bacterium]
MKRILLCAGAILVLTTLPFGQTLGNNKRLYHTTDSVRWTQCAFTPDGVLWVVWVPGNTNSKSGGPIYVGSYDGTTVTAPFNVTESGSIKANRPNITVSPKGYVLVTWGVVADKATYLRILNPKTKTWDATETVAYNFGGDEPIAQMDAAGNIHVFFTNAAGGIVYARSKINGVWEDIVKLSQQRGKQGSLTIAPNGVVHAGWIEKDTGGYKNVYTQRTLTTSWNTRASLPGGLGVSNHFWITSGPNNDVVVAWEDNNTGLENGAEIRVMKIGSSTAAIVIPFAMQHYPRVVIDSKNNIHVVCSLGGGDGGNGIRYTNKIGGTWRAIQTIPASYEKLPGLAANSLGNVAATQSSYTSSGTDIWAYSLEPIKKVAMPAADFTFSPTTGYPPLTVGIRAVPAYGPNSSEVSYGWTFSDGGTATGRNVTHLYSTHGTYTITLTITDNLGRTDEISKTIEVKKTNPLVPLNTRMTIAMSSPWKNPEITYSLFWEINPGNIPAHIQGYVIYMREGAGEYTRLLTVSPSTLSSSFRFADFKVKRGFAISTLGYGGTESPKVYFQ